MVLATVFGFLGLMAIRNMSLFGLVAGFVLTWNLGEWAEELAAQVSARWPRRAALAGLAARIALAVVIGLMIFTISLWPILPRTESAAAVRPGRVAAALRPRGGPVRWPARTAR